jgi:hypothetical protein
MLATILSPACRARKAHLPHRRRQASLCAPSGWARCPDQPLHRAHRAARDAVALRALGPALRHHPRQRTGRAAAFHHRRARAHLPPAGDGARLCRRHVRHRRARDGAPRRRPARARPGSAVRCRPHRAAHRTCPGRRAALRRALRRVPQRLHHDQLLRQLPRRRRAPHPWPQRPRHHLWAVQGAPSRSQAAAIHPHHERRRQRPSGVSLHGRQRQRLTDPHRDLEHAAHGGRPQRLPVLRGLKTVFPREHGPHRPRRRPLRHRDATQPTGGRAVPRMDSNPHARLDAGLGPAQPALQRRAA